jgi:hypothetical protein
MHHQKQYVIYLLIRHALSSEMHEFAVDWIVPVKVVNHTINRDVSIDIKPIKRSASKFFNKIFIQCTIKSNM